MLIEINNSISTSEVFSLIETNGTSSDIRQLNSAQEAVTLGSATIATAAAETTTERDTTPENAIIENDVVKRLKLTAEGKLLLKTYEKDGFDNKYRLRLSACIICAEYGADTNKIIPPIRFKELSRQIKQAFFNEDESIYYVSAFTLRGGKTLIAKDKLYDKYISINRELRDANLRDKRPNQGTAVPLNLTP